MGARVNAGAAASGATAAVTTTAATSQAVVRLAADRPGRAGQLAAEEQRQAPAHVQQRRSGRRRWPATRRARGRRTPHRDRQVRQRHPVQADGEDDLVARQHAGASSAAARPAIITAGDGHRDRDRQHCLIRPLAGQDDGQHVVDDLHGRVDQVQQ